MEKNHIKHQVSLSDGRFHQRAAGKADEAKPLGIVSREEALAQLSQPIRQKSDSSSEKAPRAQWQRVPCTIYDFDIEPSEERSNCI